jgi:hypothetical protein
MVSFTSNLIYVTARERIVLWLFHTMFESPAFISDLLTNLPISRKMKKIPGL